LGIAYDSLNKIIDKMNNISKVKQVFVTDIGGKPINWNMTFQFYLDDEEPFYLMIKEQEVSIYLGIAPGPEIVMSGDNKAIVKICNGKGDFTHAISREEIMVEKGKVMDVIRLTRAITIAIKAD
jgi:putative sterol carrier protein